MIVSTTEDLFNYTAHFDNILSLLTTLSQTSVARGTRPLAIFSSGCKDYGAGLLHGSPSLEPFTESSPLNPHPFLLLRATLSLTVLNHSGLFDAVVVRSITLYGGSSSYYGPAFDVAAAAVAMETGVLRIAANPNSIMHGTHVADCAAAYVAIAEAPRKTVAGQSYNISSERYETTKQVAAALAREYGLEQVEFTGPPSFDPSNPVQGYDVVGLLFGYSQWVGSEKLRRDTGWKDRRPAFSEAPHVYRKAYEEAARRGNSNVERVKGYVALCEAAKNGSE